MNEIANWIRESSVASGSRNQAAGEDCNQMLSRRRRKMATSLAGALVLAVGGMQLAACSRGATDEEKKARALFQEKLLAHIPNEYEEPGNGWVATFSPDVANVAYRAEIGPKAFIVVNEKKGQEFDKVRRPFFSPHGSRVGYAAKEGAKAFIVVDEEKGRQFEYVDDPVFSPDGSKLAYRSKEGDKFMVVFDNKTMPEFEMVDAPTFTPDSSKVAFVAEPMLHRYKGEKVMEASSDDFENMRFRPRANSASIIQSMKEEGGTPKLLVSNMFLIVGDNIVIENQGIQHPAFSTDGSRLAYVLVQDPSSKDRRKMYVVAGDKKGPQYDEVRYPVFSPDGAKLAYTAKQNGKWFAVIDDNRGPEFDHVEPVVFSPDGSRVAYAAKQGEKWFIVISEDRGPQFDAVGQPLFSPDGSRVAYRAKQKGKWIIAVGDKQGPKFDAIGDPVFSPDKKKIAYGAQQGRDLWRKIIDLQ